ncbi:hypothetical protein D3C81_190900 [compost metagenome]
MEPEKPPLARIPQWLKDRKAKRIKSKLAVTQKQETMLARAHPSVLVLILVASLMFSVAVRRITHDVMKSPEQRDREAVIRILKSGHPK